MPHFFSLEISKLNLASFFPINKSKLFFAITKVYIFIVIVELLPLITLFYFFVIAIAIIFVFSVVLLSKFMTSIAILTLFVEVKMPSVQIISLSLTFSIHSIFAFVVTPVSSTQIAYSSNLFIILSFRVVAYTFVAFQLP